MRDAPDDIIAAYARDNHLVLIARDFDFADIRNYPPDDYAGIVVLQLHDDATAPQVVKLLETFAQREAWLGQVSGRLAIVEVGRVRFRPA